MSKEEFLKIQKCVLKVNIHCDGCKQKVKKCLQKIDGVFTTHIDAEQGKVAVSGNVEPSILIKKLAKSGKHAELWPSHNSNHSKDLQILNPGYSLSKPSKGGSDPNKNAGIAPPLLPQLKQLDQIRGLQDLKLQPQIKDITMKGQNPQQKSTKFDLQENDDDFSDDDDLDDYDDEEFEDDEEDDEFKDIQIPQKGGIGKKDGKNDGGKKPGASGSQCQDGAAEKNGGKAGEAKMGNNNINGGKKNGVQAPNNGFQTLVAPNNRLQTLGASNGGRMVNNQAVQGLPATVANGGGGYLFSSAPESVGGNPYYREQYLAAMMDQERGVANQQMMYARPPAAINYVPPYSYPSPADPYTHYLSDESTSSCNVM